MVKLVMANSDGDSSVGDDTEVVITGLCGESSDGDG